MEYIPALETGFYEFKSRRPYLVCKYRNGYNCADLKSAVSALIRPGRSNRSLHVIKCGSRR